MCVFPNSANYKDLCREPSTSPRNNESHLFVLCSKEGMLPLARQQPPPQKKKSFVCCVGRLSRGGGVHNRPRRLGQAGTEKNI